MKKIIIILGFLFFTFFGFAQTPKEVTLVVTGEGATKEEATNNALRSAVEQAFGVFVSANTDILNDEIVKDEIATVSSGNIKSFEELACSIGEMDKHTVTIQALVSVNKLIEYSKSHGAKAEFAGALFGSNLKLAQINKDNAEKAYNQLIEQLKTMVPFLYDYSLTVSNPKVSGEVTFEIAVETSQNSAKIAEMVYNTLCAISMDEQQAKPLQEMGFELFEYEILVVTPYFGSSWLFRPLLMSTDDILSERGEKRYFYCKLDKRLNSLLCPPETLVIKDNTGRSYICKTKSDSKGIEGYKQGVIEAPGITVYNPYGTGNPFEKRARSVIIIGASEAFPGITMYKINTVHKIPIEHLQSINSFEVSPGESALN